MSDQDVLHAPTRQPKDEMHPGSRLGSYEIVSLIGAGGMGEVYRARDTRLDRFVAIKVLAPELAADREYRARFHREARVIAQLSHPNICTLHDVGEHEGVAFLVMELLQGRNLSDLLRSGPLPLAEALEVAIGVAAALGVAHRHGVTHRDVKPGNILMTATGPKLLDFGLATPAALGQAPRTENTASTHLTGAGIILGTLHYMAPEQVKGRHLDARADIWALGVVLYEMVTGRRPFDGDSPASVIANIIHTVAPAVSVHEPRAFPVLDHIVARCLAKDPEDRWQTASDLRRELQWAAELPKIATSADAVPERRRRISRIAPAFAAVALALAAAAAGWWLAPRGSFDRSVARFSLDLTPADSLPPPMRSTVLAISPDGTHVAFVGRKAAVDQLYVRRLDRLEATPVAGTEVTSPGVRIDSPFFSPDGRWVGFWTGSIDAAGMGELRRAPVAGGPAVTITKTPQLFGVSWGDDDQIVFANSRLGGLHRVRAGGGDPEPVTTVDLRTDASHRLPHVLPGSRTMLYTAQRALYGWDDARVLARSLATGEEHIVVEHAADARYSGDGYLVFVRNGTLMAQPFDPSTARVSGSPIGVVEGILQDANRGNFNESGGAQYALSSTGVLVYAPGLQPKVTNQLYWVSRSGERTLIAAPERAYGGLRLSPDGQQVLFFSSIRQAGIWTFDLALGVASPFETELPNAQSALWSGDGHDVIFRAGNVPNLYRKPADRSRPAERLRSSDVEEMPMSWSADGRVLLFGRQVTATNRDIWSLSWEGGTATARPLLETRWNEQLAEFSPDGRWVAFVSDESGSQEVYVRPYVAGPARRISPNGGGAVAWRADGKELFYRRDRNGQVDLMSVTVTTGATLTATPPQVLFTVPREQFPNLIAFRSFDVSPDGRRFLMTHGSPAPPPPTRITAVQNWNSHLIDH